MIVEESGKLICWMFVVSFFSLFKVWTLDAWGVYHMRNRVSRATAAYVLSFAAA